MPKMDPTHDDPIAPDYSGLQVVPFDTAPEHVALPSLPEVVSVAQEEKIPGPQITLEPYQGETTDSQRASGPAQAVRPWWRRKRWISVASFSFVAVIVAVVVGAVVGPRLASSATESPPPSNSTTTSTPETPQDACRDTVCPQVLSAAVLGRDISSAEVLLFARGVDNAIWYCSAPVRQLESWVWGNKWVSLGGPFLSQPSALAWESGTRVLVVAASDPDHSVKMRRFNFTTEMTEWEDLSGPTSSAIAACVVNDTRPDLWTASGTGVAHNFWLPKEGRFWAAGPGDAWQDSAHFDSPVSSRPGVVCRPAGYFHDLVAYGSDGTVRHSTFRTVWTVASNRGGNFRGEPVVVAVGSDRFDFFGIGADDGSMYHFTWTSTGGYSSLANLGGSFASVPSAVVTGLGSESRIDVVALGKNGQIQHRALHRQQWLSDWEDLGIDGDGAPLVVNITNWKPERVTVFVLKRGGQVYHALWNVSAEPSWQGLLWANLGGTMSNAFYRT